MDPDSMASMELEFKRQDGSWHPCRISLSSGNPPLGMIISFENFKKEEIISKKEDFLAQLRFRSAFLQAVECSKIKENECVLAMHDNNPSENLFFDAVVEKINRVRHSDRLLCRCTFEVQFLSSDIKSQTVKVPSNYIMRLSDKEIESHTVCKAFLESTTPRAKMEFHEFDSPLSEDESDLNCLLEKQVEENCKLAEGVDSSKDCIMGIKKANHNGIKRRNKTQIKQEINPELKGKNEITSFLSPLAARAALTVGSPVIGIQKGLEFLAFQIDKELQFPVSQIDEELTFPDSVAGEQMEKSGSEKSSFDVPRRVTGSSSRRSLDSTINQKENEKRENKKSKCISPSIDTGTSISTKSVPACEGSDAKSRPIKKKKMISTKKQPTQSSPRLSSLPKTQSQTNK